MDAIAQTPFPKTQDAVSTGTAQLSLSDGDSSCSLWWENTPEIPGQYVGCIGRLDVPNGSPALPILNLATKALRAQQCTVAIGPMDGTTWRNYRLVTATEGSPAFPLEPANPLSLSDDFETAGFSPIAKYTSSSLSIRERNLNRIRNRIAARGIVIREIKQADYASELTRLHPLCLAAFAENFLFTPLGASEFSAMYLSAETLVDPRFVLVAEGSDSIPVGFVFAFPNPSTPGSLVVKTLAVHPRKHHLGIGSVLVAEVQNRALHAGFRTAIHALQHIENSSLKITSRHGAHVIREYALLAKTLA